MSSGEERRVTASRRPAIDVISHGPEQTRRYGELLGRLVRAGDVLLLGGMIGAGKTTLVQGMGRALRAGDHIQSPTFTLVTEHDGLDADGQPLRIFHIDLYRLDGRDDTRSFGFEEYLEADDAVTIVEWPEHGRDDLPEEYLLIELDYVADQKRHIHLKPRGRRYVEMTGAFRSALAGTGAAARG
jgi:tRNA threonylcarbamoyladenosine biosynthesis protein TsaE